MAVGQAVEGGKRRRGTQSRARKLKELPDHAIHALRALEDQRNQPALFFTEAAATEQELGGHRDRAQRIA